MVVLRGRCLHDVRNHIVVYKLYKFLDDTGPVSVAMISYDIHFYELVFRKFHFSGIEMPPTHDLVQHSIRPPLDLVKKILPLPIRLASYCCYSDLRT